MARASPSAHPLLTLVPPSAPPAPEPPTARGPAPPPAPRLSRALSLDEAEHIHLWPGAQGFRSLGGQGRVSVPALNVSPANPGSGVSEQSRGCHCALCAPGGLQFTEKRAESLEDTWLS